METANFVSVEDNLDLVPVGEVNIGVVILFFGNVSDLVYKFNGVFEVFEFKLKRELFIFR